MANKPNSTKEHFWRSHILKFKQSNVSLKAYCDLLGIKGTTFNDSKKSKDCFVLRF